MSESGPISAVIDAIAIGDRTRAQIVSHTGLCADVVDAVIDHLMRTGRLSALELTSACPTGGCRGCAAPSGHGCSTPSGGPVALTLSVRPR